MSIVVQPQTGEGTGDGSKGESRPVGPEIAPSSPAGAPSPGGVIGATLIFTVHHPGERLNLLEGVVTELQWDGNALAMDAHVCRGLRRASGSS